MSRDGTDADVTAQHDEEKGSTNKRKLSRQMFPRGKREEPLNNIRSPT